MRSAAAAPALLIAAAAPTPAAATAPTCSDSSAWYADTDINDNSAKIAQMPAASPAECCANCAANPLCFVWNYQSKCKLRPKAPSLNKTAKKGCTSGIRAATPTPPPTPTPPTPSPTPAPPLPPTPTDQKFNFVTILADDWGYYDSGFMGNANVHTPSIDAIHSGGVTLRHHYAYKYCGPSRRSFLSGRTPLHLGELNQKSAIDLRMSLIPQKLAKAGYKSHMVGKSHLATPTFAHLPTSRGFDSYLGYLGGGQAYWAGHDCVNEGVNCHDFTPDLDLWHDGHPAEEQYIGQYSTELYTSVAVDIISKHDQSNGLFLHICHQAVHNPYTSPPGQPTWGDDKQKVFYEVLQGLDAGVANVTAALKQAGMWRNALLLLWADNGGTNAGNNYPLRGGKYSPWEGGVRSQSALSGGAVPAGIQGTTFDGLLHITDWFPTFCHLAGVDGTDDPKSDAPRDWVWPLDGYNVWPFITGGADPRDGVPLVLASPGGPGVSSGGQAGGAMILGTHKIVYDSQRDGWDQPDGSRVSGNGTCVSGSGGKCLVCSVALPCLYDVWADPGEARNLAGAMPDTLRALNDTYARLVFGRRSVVPLNFTAGNGWQKCADWGNYAGPNLCCAKPGGDCPVH